MTLAEARRRIAELEVAMSERDVIIEQLRALLAEQNDRIRVLEERLTQSSQNSSKPPSSDGPGVTRPPRSRGKGRKRGGQPGHRGTGRALVASCDVDAVVMCRPDVCQGCGTLLMGADPTPLRHQVVEIPPIKPVVTEYQVHQLVCPCCGANNVGGLPPGIGASHFGDRVHAMVALLAGGFRLSHREVATAMSGLFNLKLGLGTVSLIERRMRHALDGIYEEALAFVRTAAVANVDESGWREAKCRAWLWAAAAMSVAVYRLDRRRNREAGEALLGEDFGGVIVTDRFGAYNHWQRRGVCWSHLLRDFTAIAERFGSEWYGVRMAAIAKRILSAWRTWASGEIDRTALCERITPDRKRLHRLLVHAADHAPAPKTQRQCTEMLKLEEHFWTFLDIEGVPPTNNLAERCLRSAVLWRKGSFGTDSAEGSRFVERILTVVTTRKLQHLDCLEFLIDARHAYVAGSQPPSLLTVPS
jgi:transposase